MQLIDYYSARAGIYDEIYRREDIQRQKEIEALKETIYRSFAGKHLLEVACGTGYWTAEAAKVSKTVSAIDGSEAMLEKARERLGKNDRVKFKLADAYCLKDVSGEFDAGMAFCWFSHVPRRKHREFLGQLHSRLKPGSTVLFVDNSYVKGLGGGLLPKDANGDSWKLRTLGSSEVPILKNYFSVEELLKIFSSYNAAVEMQPCFWKVTYCLT